MAGQPEAQGSSIITCVSCFSASGILLRLSDVEPASQALESIWAQERIGVREGDMREWRDTRVSLPRASYSFFSPLFPSACYTGYIEQQ